MPFKKGDPRPPNAGRVGGVPNKATRNARELISVFIDNQAERLNELLDKVEAENGSKAAWDCIMSLTEFALPKLARSELTGANGGPIETKDITQTDKDIIARYEAQKND